MRLTCNRMGGFFHKVRVTNLTQGWAEGNGGVGEVGGGEGDNGVSSGECWHKKK